MRAVALDRGCYPYPGPVEVSIALDEAHLRAVLALWAAWADEEGVETYDELRMARSLANRIQTGVWLPVVAWDLNTPVGMVETAIFEDPFTGEVTGYGDHAYVLQEYRKARVFEQLVDGAILVGQVFGATVQILPMGTKTWFLKSLYERHGFEVSGYVMKRTL
jgi:GNAT superfamily N-acetyltransferase